MKSPSSLSNTALFNPGEFAQRWARARSSALPASTQEYPEEERLRLLTEEERKHVLKSVFDRSRALALSASRHFGIQLETQDLTDLLLEARLPCWYGSWSPGKDPGAAFLKRPGCEAGKSSAFACDYWKEALDGVVMGFCEHERLARHQSLGHGDESCLDILYTEAPGDAFKSASRSPRWGALPSSLLGPLEELKTRLSQTGVRFQALGVAESVLYYQVDSAEGPMCGAGGKMVRDVVSKAAKDFSPPLFAVEASPLAVLGSGS